MEAGQGGVDPEGIQLSPFGGESLHSVFGFLE